MPRKKLLTIAAAGIAAAALIFLMLRFSPYPALNNFIAREHSIRFFDREGRLVQITALEDGLRREYAVLPEIPPEIAGIFVFSEDRRFYRHPGVDCASLLRALWQNSRAGKIKSGASTITMQLARIIDGKKRGDFAGKIAEVFNAAQLEARFSKKHILEMYLNAIPFGNQSEGIVSAARTYFSKELAGLSPAEMLLLAVIPRRPALYNPLENPKAAAAAADAFRRRLVENISFVRQYPAFAAIGPEELGFAAEHARRFYYPFEMPHYIRFLSSRLRADADARPLPREIRLAADLELQKHAEALVYGNVRRSFSSRLTNGAVFILDNESGGILCWVGSADFNDVASAGQIDGVLALNQPGSSMKPFLYAMALEKGFLPSDTLADIPKNYGVEELYIPRNFNNRFNGPVLFRTALASSLNIPAVELLYRLGVKNYAATLYNLGFDSLRGAAEDAGLGLALGNMPVSLLELVRAFSVFPGDGIPVEPAAWAAVPLNGTEDTSAAPESAGLPRLFSRVHGDVRTGKERTGADSGRQTGVFGADTARIIASMLSDRGARVTAFGRAENFATPFPSMFKTGTANQYQSITALAATPRFTAGVWMGNFTGETVIGKTGSSVPAAIVRELLERLHGRRGRVGNSSVDGSAFKTPESWVLRRICALSGMAPHAGCVSSLYEWQRRGTADNAEAAGGLCTWHDDGGAVAYPAEYQSWFLSSVRNGAVDYGSAPLEIITPRDGFVFYHNEGIGRAEIPVELTGGAEDELWVDYDGQTQTVGRPFVFYLPQERGSHRLELRCGGETISVNFRVE
ncbi:MAG: transglycosylase domain-containing protein [Spirochaetaceae bacterium]|jgi:penicillin-binding protein 1C|nr:transglycosylase domain-containing protein [Spirochaetaceae bacterium]